MPELNDFSAEELAILRPLFITSARGYLVSFREQLQIAEHAEQGHDLEALHRSIHSLKGAALQLGLHSVGNLAKAMEFVVKGFRQREQALPTESYALLTAAAEHLSGLIARVEREEDLTEPPTEMLRQLSALAEAAERPARASGE